MDGWMDGMDEGNDGTTAIKWSRIQDDLVAWVD
jgi:hypothetical protein